MWKRALDESEIKANMCKILNAEEHSDLMGYWVFSKGVGGTTVLKIGEMAAADWMRKFVCRI